jgi:peptidoglycan hydrolase-like protein with peptidoglycan-binding domain
LTITKAKALRYAGYKYVGRYLTGNLGRNSPKHLTKKECAAISKAGLRLFPIYQDGGHKVAHFCFKQGMEDARTAVNAAFSLGIPRGATIYFAVDCDPNDEQLSDFVIPYFKGISTVLKKSGAKYCAGVYGTRKTCYKISKAGYAKTSFVGGLSTNFNGNLGHPLPENWAFDQFHELKGIDKFRCEEGGFNLDKNAFSGRDHGVIMHGNV